MTRVAQRAHQAGFDGVQALSVHGILLIQFLSPACNRREDAYGGSLEIRSWLLLEVVGRIRQPLGAYHAWRKTTVKPENTQYAHKVHPRKPDHEIS